MRISHARNVWGLLCVLAFAAGFIFSCPFLAHADEIACESVGEVRIHIMPFNNMDAILIECNGRFGMVDSGEDSSYPDGSGVYPLRSGVTRGNGIEDELIDYMRSVGVEKGNLEFYIGTHPHSDHIGTAPYVLREFQPPRVYTPYYADSMITIAGCLWDNLYVYDRLCEAAESYGAQLVHYLHPEYEDGAIGDNHSGAPTFMLGSARIEIMNYEPAEIDHDSIRVRDANNLSYGVKVTGSNGRIAFLSGDINNRDDSPEGTVGFGDEFKLAQVLRGVDFLKLGHHGLEGSNTPSYLKAIMRSSDDGGQPVAVQTGRYERLPLETLQTLHELGARYFNAVYAKERGLGALVVTLGDRGVTTNVDSTDIVMRPRTSAPWGYCYKNGAAMLGCRGWQVVNGSWRYFETDGSIAMGWRKVSGRWYYLNPGSGSMATGWAMVGGKWYWLDGSGAMATGWRKVGGKWYYLDGSGAMAEGWRKVSGTWYYLNPGSGSMATGWAMVGGKWYWLDGSGAMATGWRKVGGVWYRFADSGVLL